MTDNRRTVVVSDEHLGHTACNKTAFARFVRWLARETPNRLVINGDLLDLWRRNNAEVVLENKDVLRELFGLSCPIYYVPGNHDYAVYDAAVRARLDRWTDNEMIVTKKLTLKCGDHIYHLTHGYDIDVAVTMEELPIETYEAFSAAMCRAGDGLGGLASLLWSGLTTAPLRIPVLSRMQSRPSHRDDEFRQIYDVAVSGGAHLLIGAQPRHRLVFSHTHWPFCTKDQWVANTGSWCTEPGIPRHNTYVEITPAGMALKDFA